MEKTSPFTRLEFLMLKGSWCLFTNWDNESHGGKPFHLTQGMCDDFGCSDSCRDFDHLNEVFEYLESIG